MHKKIESLLDRIVDAESASVIGAYEKRVAALETEAAILTEKCEKPASPKYPFEKMFELACVFLSNPWKLWEIGNFNARRMVLKLAFAGPVSYCRNGCASTPQLSLPFKVLGG
ncbi:MAG: hypothetical protein AAF755_12090 [Pseudomonadota bacterium]